MARSIWLSMFLSVLAFGVVVTSAQGEGTASDSTSTLSVEAQASISAALQRELAKLTPSDGVHLGFFGVSVAISGNTIAVGMADTSAPGAVYIFEKPASGWGDMVQTAKLTASDGSINDYLGWSVAISGDTVVAGAPNSHSYKGSVYVFVKPTTGWVDATETAELAGSGNLSAFGASVAINGNTIVAGSPTGKVGAAYVFVKPATGWTRMPATATLKPSDGQPYQAFGTCVAISGNTIAASSPYARGEVYVFVEPATGWITTTQTARLTATGGSQGGASLAISGNTVVTGSPGATIGSNYAQGEAYVFVKPTTGWQDMNQTATLIASDGAAGDQFGYAVAISGTQVMVGAPIAQINSITQGAVYSYVQPSTGWKSTEHFNAKLIESVGANNDQLGWSVSQSGGTVVAGAPASDSAHGSAYVF